MNGVSLNTFIPLVARWYQREDFQTYEEVGRGVQPRMMGNGGFEEMDLGLHLIWSLRCGLPYLGPLIRSVWDSLILYFWWSNCSTKIYELAIIFMAISEENNSLHGLWIRSFVILVLLC